MSFNLACKKAEKDAASLFRKIEAVSEFNAKKVLYAFKKNSVSETCFAPTTGYGYNDKGREVFDAVFAEIFGAEAAIAGYSFISGTHTIANALFALLDKNDLLLSATGEPYDTLSSFINEFNFDKVEIDELAKLKKKLKKKPKILFIQRSRGYMIRRTLSISDIARLVQLTKEISPNTIVFVDNCYGEFCEKLEPADVGADIVCGSLIKNPGGGIALSGGYVAGRRDLIEKCAVRMTVPNIGREAGCNPVGYRELFQGLFLAPHTVSQALKTAVYTARLTELLGFSPDPSYKTPRSDIIQTITFNNEKALLEFIRGIQKYSPVDSHLTPEPWEMPGYADKVIMAAGTFVQGASIELSADAPIRPPYAAFIQGGLTYESGKLTITKTLESICT